MRQGRGSGDAGSDSESSACAMDEMPDPVASPVDNPSLSPVTETHEPPETPGSPPANASVTQAPPGREAEEGISDQSSPRKDAAAVQSGTEVSGQEQTEQQVGAGEPGPSSPETNASHPLQTSGPAVPEGPNTQPVSGQPVSKGQSTATDQTQAKGSDNNSQKSKKKKDTSNAPKSQTSEVHNANPDKNSNVKQTADVKAKASQQKPEKTGTVSGPKPQVR